MEDYKEKEPKGLTRRQALKVSGLALGGLAIGGVLIGPETGNTTGNTKTNTCENCCAEPDTGCKWINPDTTHYNPNSKSQKYSYFQTLDYFYPFDLKDNKTTTIAPLDPNEMRITFMGSAIPPTRRAQQMMSIFVEVGWDGTKPVDQFVFDCGAGVCANYGAMNVGFGRMDKVFLAHLHGDHMSDLTHLYCFGPSSDRKTPLYVWGPSQSNFTYTDPDNNTRGPFNDGTADYCLALRQACRWHTESFSFQVTSYTDYPYPGPNALASAWGLPPQLRGPNKGKPPSQVVDPNSPNPDAWGDAYSIVPIELDWTKTGLDSNNNPNYDNIAYYNTTTGVRITHFPVIHTRMGSIGYKLEWWPTPGDSGNLNKPHLTMIYTSDTKPETNCLNHARNGGSGVDVFIHEMIVPPNIWAMKTLDPNNNPGRETPPDPTNPVVEQTAMVQNSSHTPQGAFGYLLSQIAPAPLPRLTVATHFPVADDTVGCAMNSVQEHFTNAIVYQGNKAPHPTRSKPGKPVRITWSFDLMVITVSSDNIVEQRGYVSDFGFLPAVNLPTTGSQNPPLYWTTDSSGNIIGNSTAQIDEETAIYPCGDNCTCNYRDDGY